MLARLQYPPELYPEDLAGPQALIVVPTMELGVQVAMLVYRLFGGSVNAGVPGDKGNMFNYSGPRGIKVSAAAAARGEAPTAGVPGAGGPAAGGSPGPSRPPALASLRALPSRDLAPSHASPRLPLPPPSHALKPPPRARHRCAGC
jgi:hypothetical protein